MKGMRMLKILLRYLVIVLIFFCYSEMIEAQSSKFQKKQLVLKASSLKNIPLRFPLQMKGFRRLSSDFGLRFHPISKKNKFHHGVDLAAKRGTPVYASAAGKVTTAKHSPSYGIYVVIKHKSGYSTVYGHMMKRIVGLHQYVKQGQVIGYVGSTGRSTGPHLHYEIRYANKKINPIRFWKIALKKG